MMLHSVLLWFFIIHTSAYVIPKSKSTVTDADLQKFSEEALKSDTNNAGHLITIHGDKDKILNVNEKALQKEIVKILKEIFIADENNSPNLRNLEMEFLSLIVKTDVMQKTKQFLQNKGLINFKDQDDFVSYLFDIWFTSYKRGKHKSSGFKHVFMGEINGAQVAGLHNWVFFNLQEQQGHLVFDKLKKHKNFDEKKGSVLKMQFHWNDKLKPSGSLLVGTSPELELSLYTACFIIRANNDCPLKLGGVEINMKTFDRDTNGKKVVRTAFPEI